MDCRHVTLSSSGKMTNWPMRWDTAFWQRNRSGLPDLVAGLIFSGNPCEDSQEDLIPSSAQLHHSIDNITLWLLDPDNADSPPLFSHITHRSLATYSSYTTPIVPWQESSTDQVSATYAQ